MKIFIIGSNRHLLTLDQKKRFVACCEALGKRLSSGGNTLILCSASEHTADPHIVRGAEGNNTKCQVEVYIPQDVDGTTHAAVTQNIQTRIFPTSGGWRVCHLRAIRNSDVVVAIGGSPRGTIPVIYSAELMNRPVIVIPSFGGAAKDAWDYFSRYYDKNEEAGLLSSTSTELISWANAVVSAVSSIEKHFKSRLASHVILISIIGILATGAWLWAFFSSQPFFANEIMLCLGLASASTTGSMLRLLLRNLGVISGDWDERPLVVSVALGALMGFGMLLFAEFASLSLSGGTIAVAEHAALQRVLGTLSPLVFASALFIEMAWRRLGQKSAAYFEKH